MSKYVITIARGFGSGGKMLANRLANELGINCYEHRILSLASQYSGYGEEYFEDEKLSGAYWSNKLMKLPITLAAIPVLKKFSGNKRYFEIQSHIIKKIVENESCIIVGKCADYVLRDQDNVVSIYLDAPRDYCVKRVMERLPGTSEEEANHLIEQTDKYRSDYYKFYTNGNEWTDMLNYDLTINMGKVGEDKAIELIKQYLKLKSYID